MTTPPILLVVAVVKPTVYVTSVALATEVLIVILLLDGNPAFALANIRAGTRAALTNAAAVAIAVVRDRSALVCTIASSPF
jgi:hypothetical protein